MIGASITLLPIPVSGRQEHPLIRYQTFDTRRCIFCAPAVVTSEPESKNNNVIVLHFIVPRRSTTSVNIHAHLVLYV